MRIFQFRPDAGGSTLIADPGTHVEAVRVIEDVCV